ncbi:MAG: T9SS type A sorting domain-containing protein, partial [Ignavibacteriaceae bacterium]|nr:T9SS type A sorting domain-containing protein [Ignavibacteriaceae bacterium]
TGIEDQINGTPSQFELEQNYPNPFNPSTTIKYSISTSEFVTIKVFDVLGKEVATLVNEEKPAGNYEVDYNASQLSSGIYFYTIYSGSFVETKKMILIK